MEGLVNQEEEKKVFDKLIKYYRKLYPKVKFTKKKRKLSHKEIGNIMYTYAGEEIKATAKEKMAMVKGAIEYGYNTPIVILEKGKKMILLDGHRRVKVFWNKNISWNALIIHTNSRKKFGMEKMIMAKVKDLLD